VGSAKEQMFERDLRRRHEVLAKYLGLPLETIEDMGLEVQVSTTSDDAPSGYYVEIPEDVGDELVNTIVGIDGRTIYLPLGIFDEDDTDQ
jgi:hypothetical protein